MVSLEWIKLYEAFSEFQARAEKANFCAEKVKCIEDELFEICPIPQPKPSPLYYEEYGDDTKIK